MSSLIEHENSTLELLGNKCTKVHLYLDQYFKYFRTEAHRAILHHDKGARKIAYKFAEDYGWEVAFRAALKHIEDDMGFVLSSWEEVIPHVFFLHSTEFEEFLHFVRLEFPLDDVSPKKYNIYY